MKSEKYTKARGQWKQDQIDSELHRIKKHFERGDIENLYRYIYVRHSWIYKTILDHKLKTKLKVAKKILLVGSCMYPYSLLDMYKRFPDKSYYGLEISESFCKLARKIIDKTPTNVQIINADAFEFDYGNFEIDDMIFISCDVESEKTIEQIIKTSEAQFWVCAPYEKVWMFNLLSK